MRLPKRNGQAISDDEVMATKSAQHKPSSSRLPKPMSGRRRENDNSKSKKRRVKFEPMVDMYRVPNTDSFSQEEAESIWMQETDFLRIEFDNALALDVMENRDMAAAKEFDSNFLFCGRGLECVLPDRIDMRDNLKKSAWDAVIEEQRRQWVLHISDPSLIAKAYRQVARKPQVAAHYQGLKDERSAQEIAAADAAEGKRISHFDRKPREGRPRSKRSRNGMMQLPKESWSLSEEDKDDFTPDSPRSVGTPRTLPSDLYFPRDSVREGSLSFRSLSQSLSPDTKRKRSIVNAPLLPLSVGFSEDFPETIRTRLCDSASQATVPDLWYSPQEIDLMKNQSKFVGKPKFYLRGFEHLVEPERAQIMRRAISSVLQEQERQRNEKDISAERLSMVYKSISGGCVEAARIMGRRDKRIARMVHSQHPQLSVANEHILAREKRKVGRAKKSKKKSRSRMKSTLEVVPESNATPSRTSSTNVGESDKHVHVLQCVTVDQDDNDSVVLRRPSSERRPVSERRPPSERRSSSEEHTDPASWDESSENEETVIVSARALNQLRPSLGPRRPSAKKMSEKEERRKKRWDLVRSFSLTNLFPDMTDSDGPGDNRKGFPNLLRRSVSATSMEDRQEEDSRNRRWSVGPRRRPPLGQRRRSFARFVNRENSPYSGGDATIANSSSVEPPEDLSSGRPTSKKSELSEEDGRSSKRHRSSDVVDRPSSRRSERSEEDARRGRLPRQYSPIERPSSRRSDRNEEDDRVGRRSPQMERPSLRSSERNDEGRGGRRQLRSSLKERPSSKSSDRNEEGDRVSRRPRQNSPVEKPSSKRSETSNEDARAIRRQRSSITDRPLSKRSEASKEDTRINRRQRMHQPSDRPPSKKSDRNDDNARASRRKETRSISKKRAKTDDPRCPAAITPFGSLAWIRDWIVRSFFVVKREPLDELNKARGFGPYYTRRSFSVFEDARRRPVNLDPPPRKYDKREKDGRLNVRPGFGQTYSRKSYSAFEDYRRRPGPSPASRRRPNGERSPRSNNRLPPAVPASRRNGNEKSSRNRGNTFGPAYTRNSFSKVDDDRTKNLSGGARSTSPRRSDNHDKDRNSNRPTSAGSHERRNSFSGFEDSGGGRGRPLRSKSPKPHASNEKELRARKLTTGRSKSPKREKHKDGRTQGRSPSPSPLKKDSQKKSPRAHFSHGRSMEGTTENHSTQRPATARSLSPKKERNGDKEKRSNKRSKARSLSPMRNDKDARNRSTSKPALSKVEGNEVEEEIRFVRISSTAKENDGGAAKSPETNEGTDDDARVKGRSSTRSPSPFLKNGIQEDREVEARPSFGKLYKRHSFTDFENARVTRISTSSGRGDDQAVPDRRRSSHRSVSPTRTEDAHAQLRKNRRPSIGPIYSRKSFSHFEDAQISRRT